MSLAFLPAELYTAIIDHFNPDDAQQSTLSLTRALPYAPISHYLLFRNIVITRAEQAVRLTIRLLKPDAAQIPHYVQEFSLRDEWTVDAELIVNLLSKLLPKMRSLSFCIGTNFAPEHLEAIFHTPRPELRFLSLKFRTYVKRATYQQFLSGSYFDSTLACLAKWPDSDLASLSIVQVPMDPAEAPKVAFAQPIVFHRLDSHLSELAQSLYISSVTSFRLCIPSRAVSAPLTSSVFSLPAVELLDLSTCNVHAAELTDTILARLTQLKHLILDHGTLFRGEYRAEDWTALGKGCALAGVRRAKERERKLRQAQAAMVAVGPELPAPERRARQGRRGVSTATISVRKSPTRTSSSSGTHVVDAATVTVMRKVRLFPAAPTLRSFATTPNAFVLLENNVEIRAQFEKGWLEGLAQLLELRKRLFQSKRLGTSVIMRIVDVEEMDSASEEGLNGLVEMSEADWEVNDIEVLVTPILCLVGPDRSQAHEKGCAHSVAWTKWND
ncbi:hypothetical protein FB45DRAFT_772781 [Roridomyces roridus]|uniref:F-box domain-containing protein n=1 Tax=Roridomyces roridus TaxID=1738132 RepID=A0AAD7AXA9_9AGAR|nr:hypothetical protein FB45DRAFT_772781 [Roridomyces roridus]